MNSFEDFIGLLLIILVFAIMYFPCCNKIFKWWDKRKKKKIVDRWKEL